MGTSCICFETKSKKENNNEKKHLVDINKKNEEEQKYLADMNKKLKKRENTLKKRKSTLYI